MAHRVVQAERVMAASPQVIFDVLADPRRHREIDGSGTVQQPRGAAPQRLGLGANFSMGMHWGLPYATRNRVVEFDEPHRIAWHHGARFVWRYELFEVEGGTRVVESFDYSAPWGVGLDLLGIPQRNRAAMERTLERLAALVTAPPRDQGPSAAPRG